MRTFISGNRLDGAHQGLVKLLAKVEHLIFVGLSLGFRGVDLWSTALCPAAKRD
jgi:hypothetical protein